MINERTFRKAELMKKKGIPFIIIKYGITAFGHSNNIYEMLSIRNGRVETNALERDDAVAMIYRLSLPLLHTLDNRNTIWGDEKFKENYKKIKKNDSSNN